MVETRWCLWLAGTAVPLPECSWGRAAGPRDPPGCLRGTYVPWRWPRLPPIPVPARLFGTPGPRLGVQSQRGPHLGRWTSPGSQPCRQYRGAESPSCSQPCTQTALASPFAACALPEGRCRLFPDSYFPCASDFQLLKSVSRPCRVSPSPVPLPFSERMRDLEAAAGGFGQRIWTC